MLDKLKDILNNLYYQYGATYDIIRLSQVLDELINQEQKEKDFRIKIFKNDNK